MRLNTNKGVLHMKKIKNLLSRFLDPIIALATLSNVCTILVLLGLLSTSKLDTVTKIGTLVVASLIQLGVMKQPNNTK